MEFHYPVTIIYCLKKCLRFSKLANRLQISAIYWSLLFLKSLSYCSMSTLTKRMENEVKCAPSRGEHIAEKSNQSLLARNT